MDDVAKSLEDITIPYQLQDHYAKLDLSSCFKDGWTSDFSKSILDFICGMRLSRYPDNIPKMCIAYLFLLLYQMVLKSSFSLSIYKQLLYTSKPSNDTYVVAFLLKINFMVIVSIISRLKFYVCAHLRTPQKDLPAWQIKMAHGLLHNRYHRKPQQITVEVVKRCLCLQKWRQIPSAVCV